MRKFVSLLISLALLAVLYWKIDVTRLLPVFARCNPLWMILSLGMVVPLTLATAWRLQQLMPRAGQLGFGEANRLILVASVLNLILPSKMGDIAKAWFMRDRGHLDGSLALSLVVFEKTCDMLSLLLWCVFGLVWLGFATISGASGFNPVDVAHELGARGQWLPWALSKGGMLYLLILASVASMLVLGLLLLGSRRFARFFFDSAARYAPKKIGAKFSRLGASWSEMHRYFWQSLARLTKVAFTSVFIWFLHLLQIWMFILALRAWAPFLANLALSPLAILAGLLPLTFAGVGTRDAALVLFYAPYFDAPTAAALGLLCTARYILPALGGLPFVGNYLQMTRRNSGASSTATS
jgi:uncharacterized membrane protein YbhN (UPF0104 family)